MVAVTYGVAGVPNAETAPKGAANASTPAARAAPRKHWFLRFVDAMIAARMAQAQREIKMYTRLMPYTYDEHGNRKLKNETGDMPFGGW
jgi:hypothetical protein